MLETLHPVHLELLLDDPVEPHEGVSAEYILQTHPQLLQLRVIAEILQVLFLVHWLLLELGVLLGLHPVILPSVLRHLDVDGGQLLHLLHHVPHLL